MGDRPSGTVTFLFTDIEGSTRRWEQGPQAMRSALADHDDVLRLAVEDQGGFLFKHTGDGICAAFSSASEAVAAATAGQLALELPVRMGLATGTAEVRDGDYFGPILNRAARVMAAGHGGQILLSSSTASLIDGMDLVDLGVHRLRDISGGERLFQVRAPGLKTAFPSLRTLDAVPGNLPVQSTSLIGRESQVVQLAGLVREHRLVTLTGVGGVGKSRLALEVAAWVVEDFPDGVWLVELAAVGDPAAVPDVVATTLGMTVQTNLSVTESISEALVGRRLLLLLDNCEHVLGAAADLVEEILGRTRTVTIMATSREGLRVAAEHSWLVPSLGVDGAGSECMALFVERASAVNAGFSVGDPVEAEAIEVICRRLDGIALAIELAAARMLSMGAQDVRDRLDERFRLLAGGRRGLERHQTLRHAVAWSYDLLDDTERLVLGRCAMFAGGFDLAAAVDLCRPLDEYAVLDVLDSLVRKSLVVVEQVQGHARYGLLETIRQFAEEQLAAADRIIEVRDAHAAHFAGRAQGMYDLWVGPGHRQAVDWVEVELDNLRAGFRWAADRHHLDIATAIAAHTAMISYSLAQYEPVGWAEELMPAAVEADVRQLPRLLAAAAMSIVIGRANSALEYAQLARQLESTGRYDSAVPGVSGFVEAIALLQVGDSDSCLSILRELAASQTDASKRAAGLCGLLFVLGSLGRADEAALIADDAADAARESGWTPMIAASTGYEYGRVIAAIDPPRALAALRSGLDYSRRHRVLYAEIVTSYDLAVVEAEHGDLPRGLDLFDLAIDSFQRAGNRFNLARCLASLAMCFTRLHEQEPAAIIYGASTRLLGAAPVGGLPQAVERLRANLGATAFDRCVATGVAMETGDAVAFARQQIRLVRDSTQQSVQHR
jgi:predicted ATPase/class 3 adenylate cyclase